MEMLLDKTRLVLYSVLFFCVGVLMSICLGHIIGYMLPSVGTMLLNNLYLTGSVVTALMLWVFRDKIMEFINY